MMSDFIEHLINRHLGKGEQVMPRARARFEPDAAAAFLPQDIEEDSQRITLPTSDPDSSANVPAANMITHAVDNSNSEKQPVHNLQQPESVFQSMEVDTPVYPAVSSLDEEPTDKNKNKVFPKKHDVPPSNPPQEPVRPQGEKNPVHIVPIKPQESPGDQQSRQRQQAANELSLTTVQPMNLTEPKQVLSASQPVFTGIQNTGTEVEGLLETPAWLPGKQKEIHKRILPDDSKVEPELVVNVSIGRIEVRANQSPPPEPTRKGKKPSGVMSLETYLDQCK